MRSFEVTEVRRRHWLDAKIEVRLPVRRGMNVLNVLNFGLKDKIRPKLNEHLKVVNVVFSISLINNIRVHI